MEALGIDGKLLLAQVINFTLFFFLFKRFLAKPFFEYLKKQQQTQQEQEELLLVAQKKEASIAQKEKEILDNARTEVAAIIGDAKKTALATSEDIVGKATEEAHQLREKAKQQIESEREKLYGEVGKHLVQTATVMTKKILSEFIDQGKQDEIIKKLVKKLDSKELYEN